MQSWIIPRNKFGDSRASEVYVEAVLDPKLEVLHAARRFSEAPGSQIARAKRIIAKLNDLGLPTHHASRLSHYLEQMSSVAGRVLCDPSARSWPQLRLNAGFDLVPRVPRIGGTLVFCEFCIEQLFILIGQFAAIEPGVAGKLIQLVLNFSPILRRQASQFRNDFGFAHGSTL
jgi:hypothetical protein